MIVRLPHSPLEILTMSQSVAASVVGEDDIYSSEEEPHGRGKKAA